MKLSSVGGRTALSLFAIGIGVMRAQAQTAATNSGDALQEVIVTAERRSEDVEKIAIPISAVSGTQVEDRGEFQLDQVMRDLPSVQVQSNPQGADIVVRGVGGNDTGGISQDPDVSVFEDGVYSSQAGQNVGTVYDLNRVEVLRGPQGTLYGRNSAGGAVNILTNDPGSSFGAGVNAGYGSYAARHVDAYVNLPATTDLAFRLAVDRDLRNGYYSNGGGEVDNEGLRAKVKWQPIDSVTLLGRFEFMRQQGYGQTLTPVLSAPGPFAPADANDPWNTSTVPPGAFSSYAPWGHNEFFTYSLQADWDFGGGVLTLLPTYGNSTQLISTAGFLAPAAGSALSRTVTGQSTLEARVSSRPDAAFKWVLGGFALRSSANQAGLGVGSITPITWYAQESNNRRPASSYAGFGQVTIPWSDALRSTLGARYTVDEKSLFYGVCTSNAAVWPACGPSETGAGTYVTPGETLTTRSTSVTYTADLEYDFSPGTLGYAKISSGYKAGGYSTAVFPPIAYAPEKLIDYELGIKSRLDDNKLEINADLYLYQYKDQQVELHEILPYTNVLPAAYVPASYQTGGADAIANPQTDIVDVNAGNSRFYGAEAQLQYQLTGHDLLNGQVAYEHAVYGSFLVPINPGPPGTDYGAATSFDLSGRTEAHAPKWSGNVSYRHSWDIGNGQLSAQLNTRFQSWVYTTIQEWFASGATIQPGYHMSDATVRYSGQNDRWAIWVWGTNLENKAVVNYVYPLYKDAIDPPRMYGVNVSLKY